MSGEPWGVLEDLAAENDAEIVDGWERSTLIIRGDAAPNIASAVTQHDGLSVQLLYGTSDLVLTLGRGTPPDPAELSALEVLLGNERQQAELQAAPTVDFAVALLEPYLSGVFIQYRERAWVRSEEAFLWAFQHNWLEIGANFPRDAMRCGSSTIRLQSVEGPNPPGSLQVSVVEPDQVLGDQMSEALIQLADTAAWTQLAVNSVTEGRHLFSALHRDQDPIVEIQPNSVAGAVDLLRWRMGDNAVTREEALRYVLRFVTAASVSLPRAPTVRTLAERQFVALARDRAAEVFHAIGEGQKATSELLQSTSESLAKLVEDTTTTASATVAAVIGVVALIAQNGELLPRWLIIVATLCVIAGVGAVIASRWRRIQDQQDAALRLENRIDHDPLLPPEERATFTDEIKAAKLSDRAKSARISIFSLGAAAAAVALAAALWLVISPPSAPKPATSPTTSTTTMVPSSHSGARVK